MPCDHSVQHFPQNKRAITTIPTLLINRLELKPFAQTICGRKRGGPGCEIEGTVNVLRAQRPLEELLRIIDSHFANDHTTMRSILNGYYSPEWTKRLRILNVPASPRSSLPAGSHIPPAELLTRLPMRPRTPLIDMGLQGSAKDTVAQVEHDLDVVRKEMRRLAGV